ncbi:MAG TPA: response regulator transcription factor [Pyrinomonadaceae bacterium]|nr:response regulator transcription factor [Pyrinomonadaceae bacterium]
MSVLIVDDNPIIRHAIRRFIGEFAGEINECSDGSVAFDAYRKHAPDLVLMDIEMPGKDGISATREICDCFPGAHVVMVTDHDSSEMRVAATDAGAKDLIGKENLLALQSLFVQPSAIRSLGVER